MEEITWEEMREIQRNERNSPTLQKIEPNTYKRIIEYISERKKIIEEAYKDGSEIGSELAKKAETEMKNAKKILDDLIYRRNEKIVKNAVRAILTGVEDTTNMLEEEEKLYKKVLDALKEFKMDLNNEEKAEIKKGNENLKLIRMLSDIPQFEFDDKIYGPFKKEDLANLPKKVAEILINAGKANLVGDGYEDSKGN